MCCDKELVSLLDEDVTKEKNELRVELLKFKNIGKDTPLSMITLSKQEKDSCYLKALETVTQNLPEETKDEYKREIRKRHDAAKKTRNEVREALLAGTTKKKPSVIPKKEGLEGKPITGDPHFEALMRDAKKMQLEELQHAGIIEFSQDGDMIILV
ncbi:MAG: hypothetical protein ACD_8C00142G0004 [uncultured bacterium]|nr:MAG: hypothetical protein ACD_8C00142G0004 [uncultured bacterium]